MGSTWPTCATLGHPDGQLELTENSGDIPWLFAIAPFADTSAMAKAALGIALADMAPEPFANFTRRNNPGLWTQPLCNQIIVTG
jgi:hypothetical protein